MIIEGTEWIQTFICFVPFNYDVNQNFEEKFSVNPIYQIYIKRYIFKNTAETCLNLCSLFRETGKNKWNFFVVNIPQQYTAIIFVCEISQ